MLVEWGHIETRTQETGGGDYGGQQLDSRGVQRVVAGADRGGGAKGIADGLEDMAAVGFDGLAEQGVVVGEGETHGLGELLPELGAALDVGEQEGDGASGSLGHSGPPVEGEASLYRKAVTAAKKQTLNMKQPEFWTGREFVGHAGAFRPQSLLKRALLLTRTGA